MTGIRRYYRLFKIYTAKSIKAVMLYRWSFLINCISQALDYGISFLLMWIMISAFNSMNGWNSYEVMMLYSTSLFSYGIAGTFFFTIFLNLPNMIHTGNFDDVLVKPIRVLPYLISSNYMCNYIAHIVLSTIVMIICAGRLDYSINWLLVAIVIISGSFIYAGLFLIVSASAFWAIKIDALFEIMYFFREVSYYPISVFPHIIQVIVTVIIPYGMMNYYPLKLMFNKQDIAFGDGFAYAFPAFTIVFFVLANVYFVLCRRLYTSSGS